MTGVDERGRTFDAEGECLNKLGVPLNPNMLSINCLTRWTFNGCEGYGEDHENWTPAAAREVITQHEAASLSAEQLEFLLRKREVAV